MALPVGFHHCDLNLELPMWPARWALQLEALDRLSTDPNIIHHLMQVQFSRPHQRFHPLCGVCMHHINVEFGFFQLGGRRQRNQQFLIPDWVLAIVDINLC
jgi:hypothetical protein